MYKRQVLRRTVPVSQIVSGYETRWENSVIRGRNRMQTIICLLYTSDAADERSSVDLGGRRIIKKKKRCGIGSSYD